MLRYGPGVGGGTQEEKEKKKKEKFLLCESKGHRPLRGRCPKTANIIPKIIGDTDTRKPQDEVIQCSKYETKTIIIARFCMLECGENFKGKLSESCSMCNMVDDGDHRLNYCIRQRDVNLYDDEVK